MKVYLICENVDLGYHVVSAYKNEALALAKVSELNSKYNEDKINNLIKNCNYSMAAAQQWVNDHAAEYFIESVAVNLSEQ